MASILDILGVNLGGNALPQQTPGVNQTPLQTQAPVDPIAGLMERLQSAQAATEAAGQQEPLGKRGGLALALAALGDTLLQTNAMKFGGAPPPSAVQRLVARREGRRRERVGVAAQREQDAQRALERGQRRQARREDITEEREFQAGLAEGERKEQEDFVRAQADARGISTADRSIAEISADLDMFERAREEEKELTKAAINAKVDLSRIPQDATNEQKWRILSSLIQQKEGGGLDMKSLGPAMAYLSQVEAGVATEGLASFGDNPGFIRDNFTAQLRRVGILPGSSEFAFAMAEFESGVGKQVDAAKARQTRERVGQITESALAQQVGPRAPIPQDPIQNIFEQFERGVQSTRSQRQLEQDIAGRQFVTGAGKL